MEEQKVIITENLKTELEAAIHECNPDRIVVLTDSNTSRLCLPVVEGYGCLQGASHITIDAGDEHKTLDSLVHVWTELQRHGATRHSLLINLGGGMVTDLGGFAASTFKRGMHFVNIPTTLLAMVDASVGGKTGINFGGLKNEVGVFRNADAVIIDTTFLNTLDTENLLSGYAEMLKHGLLSDKSTLAQLLNNPISPISPIRPISPISPISPIRPIRPISPIRPIGHIAALLPQSIAVKQRIVLADPTEQGLRKALNLGHTIGHAFESLSLERYGQGLCPRPVLHGYAVAWGLVCELYLSAVKTGFPTEWLHQVARFVHAAYGQMAVSCNDYPALLRLMAHDKKNTGSDINFTLLRDVGDVAINQTATQKDIEEALDFYRETGVVKQNEQRPPYLNDIGGRKTKRDAAVSQRVTAASQRVTRK